jgi:hypothetical protein
LHNVFYAGSAYASGWISDHVPRRKIILAGGYALACVTAGEPIIHLTREALEKASEMAAELRKVLMEFPEVSSVVTHTGRNDDGTDPWPPTRTLPATGSKRTMPKCA